MKRLGKLTGDFITDVIVSFFAMVFVFMIKSFVAGEFIEWTWMEARKDWVILFFILIGIRWVDSLFDRISD